MAKYAEKDCAISGVGQSEIFRKPQVLPFELALRACERAIADAGLTAADIDGVACWPMTPAGTAYGFGAASIPDVCQSLGIRPAWWSEASVAAQISPIMEAVAAIAAGYATHVLCFRAVGQRWIPADGGAAGEGNHPAPVAGYEFMIPYRAPSAANWIACHASTHMTHYGITREQMGWIPVVQRRNAGLNPQAIYRHPFTIEEYLQARMISTPFSLLDCDIPCDGTTAVIVSRADAARDLPNPPIVIEAIAAGGQERMETWLARPDYPHMALHDATKRMWNRTDLKPSDVDTAHLYDGFTWLTMVWMEAFGFCGEGESGAFIEGGQRISLDGELPLNPNGGQLSEGRMHGLGFVHEAVLQLRGQAGARQAKKAVNVSAVGAGGGSLGGAMLLRRES
ncbi:MAG: thiolase family protein [Novosphingobium sp.]|nr:thiolase family protein [Novosphingobium sp.]